MSLEDWIEQTWPQASVEAARPQNVSLPEVEVEPCEFEQLLERAMEILNAHAQGSSSSRL